MRACFKPDHGRAGSKHQSASNINRRRFNRVVEQIGRKPARLPSQSLGEPRTTADGISQPLSPFHEGAAPLLCAQDALLHQSCNGRAHRVPIDTKAFGQRHLGGHTPLAAEHAFADLAPHTVGDLPPERYAAAPLDHRFLFLRLRQNSVLPGCAVISASWTPVRQKPIICLVV